MGSRDIFLLVHQNVLNIVASLLVIFNLSPQNLNFFVLLVQLFVEVHLLLSKPGELLVVTMADLLLLVDEPLLVLDLLSQIKVSLIFNAGLLSHSSEFT